MFLRRRLLGVDGTFTRILDGQRGGDDHDFPHTTVVLGRQHHAGQSWVQGQLGEFASQRGQPAAPGGGRGPTCFVGFPRAFHLDGAELDEQQHSVGHTACVRSVDKGKSRDVAQAQCGHRQDDGGEVRAQDFRIGERRAGGEVLRRIQPDADTVGHPAATPLTLVRRRL